MAALLIYIKSQTLLPARAGPRAGRRAADAATSTTSCPIDRIKAVAHMLRDKEEEQSADLAALGPDRARCPTRTWTWSRSRSSTWPNRSSP